MQRRYHQNKTAHVGHENKLKKKEEQHSCLLWENEDEATQHELQ